MSRVAAYAVIVSPQREILLTVLPDGRYTLPGGGLEPGEQTVDAVVREVREETGFEVAPTRLVGTHVIQGSSDGKPRHGTRLVYTATITGGSLVPGSDDSCVDAKWVPLVELPESQRVDLVDEAVRMAGLNLTVPPADRGTVLAYYPESWADWEQAFPLAWLEGHRPYDEKTPQIVRITADGQPSTSMAGEVVRPDAAVADYVPSGPFGDAALDGVSMLILPGGNAWDTPPPVVQELVEACRKRGITVAAMCAATRYLAGLGVLDDVAHTSNDAGYLAETGYAGGEHFRDAPCVNDGGVITAPGSRPVQFTAEVMCDLGLWTKDGMADKWVKLFTGD